MIVMKFGGASLKDAESVERAIEIIRGRLERRPVIVVSAMGKTTRGLLDAAEASAAHNSKSALQAIAALEQRHLEDVMLLIKAPASAAVADAIDRNFRELEKLLGGLAILGTVPPRGLDRILSYGEVVSSIIIEGAMAERGLPALLVDARKFIITDDRYGSARPLFDETSRLISTLISPRIGEGLTPITQGFIGATREGVTTTLGFEGSDYTATIIGAALGANDVEIWKEVSGLMTADPEVYSGVRTVKECSYAEAAELTRFGAKVLHPKAIQPAAAKEIPVHIYNARKPDGSFTSVSGGAGASPSLLKSITYIRPVSLISVALDDLSGGGHASESSSLRALTDLMERRTLAPLILMVSGMNAVLVIEARLAEAAGRDMLEDLSRIGPIEIENHKAIVTLVGEGLNLTSSVAAKVFCAIRDTTVDLMARGPSSMTMNLVVEEREVESVIARLHKEFFES